MASIISNGTSSVGVLQKQNIQETYSFFENIARVVNNDITNKYYHGNPNEDTTITDYINNLSEVKRLSTGRMTNATLDAWGKPVKGMIYTQYEPFSTSSDPNNNIQIPITTFALVSGGPNRVVETVIPATVANASNVKSISAPTGSDDIVYTFDNRQAQATLLNTIQLRLNRIGTASLKAIQSELADHRRKKLAEYQKRIADGENVDVSEVVDITDDPDAPHFLVLDRSPDGIKNRRTLGVDEDFTILETALPKISGAAMANGGKFIVSSTEPKTPSEPMQIILMNSSNKTPWGDPSKSKPFRFQITIQAISDKV